MYACRDDARKSRHVSLFQPLEEPPLCHVSTLPLIDFTGLASRPGFHPESLLSPRVPNCVFLLFLEESRASTTSYYRCQSLLEVVEMNGCGEWQFDLIVSPLGLSPSHHRVLDQETPRTYTSAESGSTRVSSSGRFSIVEIQWSSERSIENRVAEVGYTTLPVSIWLSHLQTPSRPLRASFGFRLRYPACVDEWPGSPHSPQGCVRVSMPLTSVFIGGQLRVHDALEHTTRDLSRSHLQQQRRSHWRISALECPNFPKGLARSVTLVYEGTCPLLHTTQFHISH